MKILKGFMALVLVVLLLAAVGCGDKPENGDPSDNQNGDVDENGTGDADDPGHDNGNNDPGIGESYFAAKGGWKHCDFKTGQFMKYSVTSARGLEGWVSIKVDSGEGGNLDLTIEGNWVIGGDISENATLTRGMEPFDFVYTLSTDASNLLSGLFIFDNIPFHQVKWEEGYRWEEDEKILEVGGEETYAGVTGRMVTYEAPHAFTGETQNYEYAVKLDFPLPLYVETPAANDIWYYQLTEVSGF